MFGNAVWVLQRCGIGAGRVTKRVFLSSTKHFFLLFFYVGTSGYAASKQEPPPDALQRFFVCILYMSACCTKDLGIAFVAAG